MRGRTRSTRIGSGGELPTRACTASRTDSISRWFSCSAARTSGVSAIGCSSGTVPASSSSDSIRRALATASSTPASCAVVISSCTRSNATRSSVANTVPSSGIGSSNCPSGSRRPGRRSGRDG